MSEQDFLQEAISEFSAAMDAFDRSENATSERMMTAGLNVSERRQRWAQTLALLSLAQDVRRIADALERQAVGDEMAESVRIFGLGS